MIFFIPPVGDLPEIEECLYLTTTMEFIHYKYKLCFLSQSSMCQSMVIKSAINLRIEIVF